MAEKSLKSRPRGSMGQLQLVRGQLPQACPGGTQTGTKWMLLPSWICLVRSQTGPRGSSSPDDTVLCFWAGRTWGRCGHPEEAHARYGHTCHERCHCEREASQLCTQAVPANRAREGRQLLPTHSKLAPGKGPQLWKI